MVGPAGRLAVHTPAGLDAAPDRRLRRRDAFADFLAREPFLLLLVALEVIVLCFRLPERLRADTWLTLVTGRLISQDGLPHHETLTVWSQGDKWIDQQWLGQLALYGVDRLGGIVLVLLANVALIVGAFTLALVFARRSGASGRSVAIVGIVGFLVALPNSVARTQSFAFLFFVGLFWLLASQVKAPSWRVYLALPLLIVWANVHGSVALGAGLVLIWSFAELVRAGRRSDAWPARIRAIALAVGALLCLLVSPYGLDVVDYYRSTLGSSAFRDLVSEWQGTTFPAQWPFFVLALGSIWLVARKPRRLSLFEHLALVCTAFAAFDALRNLVWFALVAVMVVPRALDDVWPVADVPLRRRVNIVLSIASLVVLGASFVFAAAQRDTWYTESFPPKAAAAVSRVAAEDPSAKVFSNEAYSDWLLWKVPSLSGRVAFDSRFELMSTRQLLSVARFRSGSSANRLAPTKGYRLLVLDPSVEKRAIRAVLREPGSRRLFRDSHVVVLLRSARE